MSGKSSALFAVITFCFFGPAWGQTAANTSEKKISWNLDQQLSAPAPLNMSMSMYKFGDLVLPALGECFATSTQATLAFYDLEYQPLPGFQAYKSKYLAKLHGEAAPRTYYTMEGLKGNTGYRLCPFKVEGGNFFILTAYKYRVQDGTPFQAATRTSIAKRATSSVLAGGQWYKISVTSDGIYKMDASFLESNGVSLGNPDIGSVKLYGHQGGMLSEVNADFRYDDLPENAIQVVDNNGDGRFNGSDYILFYAESPNKWKYAPTQNRFRHEVNIYSDKTYFFLTFGGSLGGKRITIKGDGSSLTADKSFNWFDYYTFHDDDKENICNEGRVVMGERFEQNINYSFNHHLANITTNKQVSVYFEAGAISPSNSTLACKLNGNFVASINFNPFDPESHDCYDGGNGVQVGSIANAGEDVNVEFSYNKPNSSSKAWLNYYELHASRKLTFSEGFMPFRCIQSSSAIVAEYRLSGLPASYQLLDVTDPVNVKIQSVFNDNSEWVFRDQPIGTIHQFVLNDGNTMTPTVEGAVANQNLHATGIVQFIIVTHPDLKAAADKLADYHRNKDNMDVLVVTPQQIYNEFSSGSQDISAIRDFFKLVYYNNTNPVNQLRYAMFMGDASYDYKDKIPNNTNFVPTYESEPKWIIPNNYTGYYCSDDFFGYLDPTDGKWDNEQKLEITVNRLPVASASEAMSMVDKIINYKSTVSLGEWRNYVSFFADDADALWEANFVYTFEDIYKMLDSTYKNVVVRKVYLDAFKQENLGGSQRYPEAQVAIKKEFEKGCLIFNYIGHGGEEYLAKEKVLDIPLITGLSNYDNLPVFFTATCEFSRYDDAKRKSAGEDVITHPHGGSVAMFTTVRVVTEGANAELTEYFWKYCAYSPIGGRWPTLGEIYKKLKNRPNLNANDRMFTLFADPAITMDYPEFKVMIDSVNNSNVNSGSDTARALSLVRFAGHIEDLSGNKLTSFNGSVFPTVYDKESEFTTLGNDLPDLKIPFTLFTNVLYKGENTVKNGDYSFSFVVPKDINYNYGYGKISMYADNGTTDANGHYTDLVIGGASDHAASDVTGPQLELYIDDYSFVNGGLTDNTPLLLARVFDENGINTTGTGIGRDIVAIIDKGTPNEKRFVLNSFYTSKLNSYTTGDIKYQMEYLADGPHTYTLKVWDVYNNSSEATIDFVIKNNEDISITNVLNYPNPFSTNTTFLFDHNKAGENLHVVITVMTISGKVLKTIDQTILAAPGHVSEIHWNGRDDYEDKPSKGVYIYRIVVSTDDGKKTEKVEKLVILN